jgi:ABC-type uncharacterized transport system permease subunit
MDVVPVVLVVVTAVTPFVVVWWLLRRGSRGGTVRSLGNRKASGRTTDQHAATDRYEAASAAERSRRRDDGVVARVRRWIRHRRQE